MTDWADDIAYTLVDEEASVRTIATALREAKRNGKREGIQEAIDLMDEKHVRELAASEEKQ